MRKRCHRRDGWRGECALVRDVWSDARWVCIGERTPFCLLFMKSSGRLSSAEPPSCSHSAAVDAIGGLPIVTEPASPSTTRDERALGCAAASSAFPRRDAGRGPPNARVEHGASMPTRRPKPRVHRCVDLRMLGPSTCMLVNFPRRGRGFCISYARDLAMPCSQSGPFKVYSHSLPRHCPLRLQRAGDGEW